MKKNTVMKPMMAKAMAMILLFVLVMGGSKAGREMPVSAAMKDAGVYNPQLFWWPPFGLGWFNPFFKPRFGHFPWRQQQLKDISTSSKPSATPRYKSP
ncbi:hypothetical protein OWV82_001384 [Melia azedarach]|uniref:Uncharacterized protein n=1 Tax=Melia azedarach TaxID=155640 RepID=A0ACC1YZ22_MELAZ|nr:hypothetical protein OWV82_001384 [Melia azedarach]